MSRKTKRSVESDIEQLKEQTGDDIQPMVLNLAFFEHEGQWPTWDESPHPELTIQPFPERKPNSLKIAVPNFIPEQFLQERCLLINTCDSPGKYTSSIDEDDDAEVFACELWDALSDEDLKREKEYREENDEPIPAILKNL